MSTLKKIIAVDKVDLNPNNTLRWRKDYENRFLKIEEYLTFKPILTTFYHDPALNFEPIISFFKNYKKDNNPQLWPMFAGMLVIDSILSEKSLQKNILDLFALLLKPVKPVNNKDFEEKLWENFATMFLIIRYRAEERLTKRVVNALLITVALILEYKNTKDNPTNESNLIKKLTQNSKKDPNNNSLLDFVQNNKAWNKIQTALSITIEKDWQGVPIPYIKDIFQKITYLLSDTKMPENNNNKEKTTRQKEHDAQELIYLEKLKPIISTYLTTLGLEKSDINKIENMIPVKTLKRKAPENHGDTLRKQIKQEHDEIKIEEN